MPDPVSFYDYAENSVKVHMYMRQRIIIVLFIAFVISYPTRLYDARLNIESSNSLPRNVKVTDQPLLPIKSYCHENFFNKNGTKNQQTLHNSTVLHYR